jgi:hypothetical protein
MFLNRTDTTDVTPIDPASTIAKPACMTVCVHDSEGHESRGGSEQVNDEGEVAFSVMCGMVGCCEPVAAAVVRVSRRGGGSFRT